MTLRLFLCYNLHKLHIEVMLVMENNKLTCKSCGYSSFGEGKLDGYAKLRPVNNSLSIGSPLIFTVCQNCGEVASIKVTKPQKFR